MRDYGPGTYGDLWADVYDDWTGERFGEESTAAAVERLASLAEGGRVLELAIGTGRVALPLVERGLEVHGVDASTEMVSKLRAKPGGDRIDVKIGDFADVGVEGGSTSSSSCSTRCSRSPRSRIRCAASATSRST